MFLCFYSHIDVLQLWGTGLQMLVKPPIF